MKREYRSVGCEKTFLKMENEGIEGIRDRGVLMMKGKMMIGPC